MTTTHGTNTDERPQGALLDDSDFLDLPRGHVMVPASSVNT